MRAATTKIPHLLYEKGLFKTLHEMCDFIYNWWFIWWEWEKNPEIYKNMKAKTKEKIPPIHPFAKMEADCFPVSENTENKPNLPLVGRGS